MNVVSVRPESGLYGGTPKNTVFLPVAVEMVKMLPPGCPILALCRVILALLLLRSGSSQPDREKCEWRHRLGRDAAVPWAHLHIWTVIGCPCNDWAVLHLKIRPRLCYQCVISVTIKTIFLKFWIQVQVQLVCVSIERCFAVLLSFHLVLMLHTVYFERPYCL